MNHFLHNKLSDSIKEYPDRPAIIHRGKSLTYAQVWESVSSFAGWLSTNFERGSRVAICTENSPASVYSLYAIPTAGMIAVPIDANIHERNLEYILNNCDATVVIIFNRHLSKIIKISKHVNLKTIILCGDRTNISCNGISFLYLNKLIKNPKKSMGFELSGLDEKETAVILYTTGTAGPRKGVMLSHFNLLSATKNINQFMQLSNGVVESLPMPLSHSFGFARLRSVFDVGGTVILEDGLLRPELILRNIDDYNVTSFASVPAGFDILLSDYYREGFSKIGRQLRFIEIGSAFMRREHKELLMKYCPAARICMHFGLTEASRSTFIEFHSEKKYLHTVGRPSLNVCIEICNDAGESLGKNVLGEIIVRGDMVMQGYWNSDEFTKKALKDGWLHTGDLGLVDENGYLHLRGRREDIINIGGFKVGPSEVENILLKFEGVLEAAVVGIPSSDGVTTGKVRGYLVVTDRNKFADFKELKNFCLREMEPYKVPHEFIILKSLPKTDTGKVQRYLLRKVRDVSFEGACL